MAAAGQADASIVVAWSGLAAARELQKRCGVPYVVGKPWCAEDACILAELARKATNGEAQGGALCMWNAPARAAGSELAGTSKPASPTATASSLGTASPAPAETHVAERRMTAETPAGKTVTASSARPSPILLLGEQVAMRSLRMHVRAALAQAGTTAPVVVATRFAADPAFAEPGDLSEVGERELIAWAQANPGFTWIGDPLFERIPALAGHGAAILPHEATSSTLYADLAKELAGGAALEHVQRGIMERCIQKSQAD